MVLSTICRFKDLRFLRVLSCNFDVPPVPVEPTCDNVPPHHYDYSVSIFEIKRVDCAANNQSISSVWLRNSCDPCPIYGSFKLIIFSLIRKFSNFMQHNALGTALLTPSVLPVGIVMENRPPWLKSLVQTLWPGDSQISNFSCGNLGLLLMQRVIAKSLFLVTVTAMAEKKSFSEENAKRLKLDGRS